MAVEKSIVPATTITAKTLQSFRRPSDEGGARNFFLKLMRARLAGVGLLIATLFVLMALLAPLMAPQDPYKQRVTNMLRSPSAANWLGTDQLGRDILSRIIYGSQISMVVGVLAVGTSLLIGVPLGLIAGYWSNTRLEQIIMRAMDALLA